MSPSSGTICRIVWDYPENGKPSFGIQPVFYYLSKEQARQGYDVHILTVRRASQARLEEDGGGIVVHRLDAPFNISALKELRDITRNNGGAIIHTHSTSGLLMPLAKKVLRLPLVSHVHGTTRAHRLPTDSVKGPERAYSLLKSAYYIQREKFLWSSASKVLAVSRATAEVLVNFYSIPEEKIEVVYNGVDTEIFRPVGLGAPLRGLEGLDGKRVVLYVGHFGMRKGILHLISAMKDVVKEVPDAVLVCIGGTPSWLGGKDYWTILREAARKNGLDGRVILLDKLPNQILPYYYSRCSVLVLPSYWEAFGKVVIEAMACGKPVVATRRGGLPELVNEGVTGSLVDYGSVPQLSKAIIGILQDPTTASRMGINARQKVLEKFTWKAVAERIKNVYENLAHGE